MKKCIKCEILRVNEAFEPRRNVCRICFKLAAREYYRRTYVPVPKHLRRQRQTPQQKSQKERDRKLLSRYQVTRETFLGLVQSQEGRCAICSEVPKRLVIDHNHHSGQVRALLCDKCNTAIGSFRESPDLMLEGILYLIRWNQNEAA